VREVIQPDVLGRALLATGQVSSIVVGDRPDQHHGHQRHRDDRGWARRDVELSDEGMDRIDEIVPPGTDVTALDEEYRPPALLETTLWRRPAGLRSAA
jgi:hypothetical protein